MNSRFDSFLSAEGINRQFTVLYTPQQNDVAEWANHTLIEMARTMMVHVGVNEYLWAEAVNTAAYIRNRRPIRQLENRTPYEVWFGRKPNVNHLKIFGSYAVSLDKSINKSKFKAKCTPYIMVGYSATSKAYHLFDKSTRSVVEDRDVLFSEELFDVDMENNDNYEIPRKPEDYLAKYLRDGDSSAAIVDKDCQPSVQKSENQENSDTDDDDIKYDDDNETERRTICPGRPKIIRSGKIGRPKKQYDEIQQEDSKLNVAIKENIPLRVEDALSSKNKDFWK